MEAFSEAVEAPHRDLPHGKDTVDLCDECFKRYEKEMRARAKDILDSCFLRDCLFKRQRKLGDIIPKCNGIPYNPCGRCKHYERSKDRRNV